MMTYEEQRSKERQVKFSAENALYYNSPVNPICRFTRLPEDIGVEELKKILDGIEPDHEVHVGSMYYVRHSKDGALYSLGGKSKCEINYI